MRIFTLYLSSWTVYHQYFCAVMKRIDAFCLISCIIFFSSCAAMTPACFTSGSISGRKYLDEDVKLVYVHHDGLACKEHNIIRRFDQKVTDKLIDKKGYREYVFLFQTTNTMYWDSRVFYIRLFRSIEERDSFLENSDRKFSEFSAIINSDSFEQRWNKLKFKNHMMSFIKLFPEFTNFYFQRDFTYESDMTYQYQSVKLTFDERGRLLTWEK